MDAIKAGLQAAVPTAFKDARMTLEAALFTSSLAPDVAQVAAYAVALSRGNRTLSALLAQGLSEAQVEQGSVAAAIMGMTNVYYSFMDYAGLPGVKALPPQIRMVSYGQQATKDKVGFEVATLAVSIAGRCKSCITAHADALQQHGFTDEQFRDIGRLAAAVSSLANVV